MTLSKIYKILLLLLICLSILVTGCVDDNLTAEQIADKMQEKQDSIEDYSYTMYMTMSFNGQEQVMEAYTMFKKPNKYKSIQKQPAETAGTVMVSDGSTMWIYSPQQNTVMTMELPEISGQNELDYQQLVEMMLNESDFSLKGVEKFDGRTAYVIKMASKDGNDMDLFGNMEMWIDKETWMPLKMEMKDADGNPALSAEYRNFQINTGIPDEEFRFEIPEGAKIQTMDEMVLPQRMTLEEAQEQATFEILVPSYLPDGYEFDNAIIMDGMSEVVSLTYRNGDEFLGISEVVYEGGMQESSIMGNSESVMIHGVEGKLITIFGESKMLQWNINDIQITLSASLDKEELIMIAESM
ncbi:MAG: DUF4367 domain-containing protein [ANME-2 cluster archaeon]|nr:DUF4367 domain-containing protein [ANME-2 cluster archaeon]